MMLLFLNNYQFVNPWLLLLLLLLPALGVWYWMQHQKRYPTMRISSLSGVATQSLRGRLRPLLPILRGLALLFFIVALARPQEVLKEEEIKAEGIDIFLAMDLSSSMLAQDFKPNRLEVSKKVATEFVGKREFDRIGLAVFSGEAFTQTPLTTDHEVVKNFLSELKCGTLEDGTAIGMGLATAINRLKESIAKSKIIILLTDGVNNSGYIKPLTATEIAKEFDIKVYTIGVGSNGAAIMPTQRRSDGRYIFGMANVEIDEELLQQISEETGGRYFRATSEEALEQIYAEIDRLEKTEMEVTVIKRYSEEFGTFLFWGLLFLLLELVLRYTFLRAIP